MAVEKTVAPLGSSASISRFQRIVLAWDYLRLLRDSTKKDSKDKSRDGLQRVKNTYRDVEDYIGVFEPLLFEEVKAQIVQGKDEDEALAWEKGAVDSCTEADEFHKVSMAVRDEFREELSENDLLLLSKEKFQEGASPSTYAFAIVEQRGGREMLTLRAFLAGDVKELNGNEVEHSARLLKMLAVLKIRESFLWILKICSLSTIMREYVAMHSVTSLPFKDLILSATDKPGYKNSEDRAWNIPQPLMEFFESNLNDSQLEAIHAGLSRKPFVLIQGPPGTGKTQTILGLLSAVLHAAPARVQSGGGSSIVKCQQEMNIQDKYYHWTKASPWLTGVNPRDMIMPIDGDDGFFPTGNELKPEVVKSNRKYRAHVLVCAPSNSALDEIVLRVLQTGIHDENDRVYNPKIVRIGLKPHHSVQAVSIDYLVEQKLASVDQSSGVKKPGSGRAVDRDRIRASILDEAAIVFSTLSFSGSALFSRMNRVFDIVIIDEAAQAVEPATLVPLAHGCRQVFLVGDPVQLPATVISSTAEKLGYGTSLFKRFQGAGFPVQMLKTQYRMHPEISIFPSKEFYDGSLENGSLVERQTKRQWHAYRCFGPFCFFDIDGTESQPSGSGSWVNEEEVDFIILLYHKLVNQYTELRSSSQLAIISPYRYQVKLLRDRIRENFGERSDHLVDINTVDGFQGREKDVAIFSCVRANKGKGIGFVSDFRRMNVGITRARSSVLVVGSASTLIQDDHWKNLVSSAKDRNCYFKVTKPYAAFFNDSNLESFRVKSSEIMKEEMVKKMEEKMVEMIDVGNAGDEDGGVEEDDFPMDIDDGGPDE
ncbi:probable helicase MAGATAMA 3 [Dioscorea cayenensis subsp. rotundata]|uniref:Probable helicase MAGATAMA 3 n=1 Tax=Dioscorea cayennensis subsp. rotundata TaxID=55577 RepID=A0AB40CMK5_DIOCR|nr:probable helicase MAGATAMA 3 [Dioscorea cayenensis subsp. rotundata]